MPPRDPCRFPHQDGEADHLCIIHLRSRAVAPRRKSISRDELDDVRREAIVDRRVDPDA